MNWEDTDDSWEPVSYPSSAPECSIDRLIKGAFPGDFQSWEDVAHSQEEESTASDVLPFLGIEAPLILVNWFMGELCGHLLPDNVAPPAIMKVSDNEWVIGFTPFFPVMNDDKQ